MPFKNKKSITKPSLPPAKRRRRSSRKGAGTRPPTYFEEYADDISKVLLEGEDRNEVLEAFELESDDASIVSEDEQAQAQEDDEEFIVEDEDDSDAEAEDDLEYYQNIVVDDSESESDSEDF